MSTNLPTRKDYMDGTVTFEAFYGSVARTAGVSMASSDLLPRVKAALASGDEYLNSIPIATWNLLAAGVQPAISASLKRHGDFWSLAGGVCTMKPAALDAAKASKQVALTHFELTLPEEQALYPQKYIDPDRYKLGHRDYHPTMLCRTGDGHAVGTRERSAVTCPACVKKLAE